MATSTGTKPDWTMMYGYHAGFRRDADRLVAAAENREFGKPSVKTGWETFRDQLVRHHHAEDDDMWPVARAKLTQNPEGLKLLDDMQAEHAQIDPLIEQIDAAFANPEADPEKAIELSKSFRDHVNAHLAHEESAVLPLLDTCYTRDDLKAFSDIQRKKGGMKEGKVMFAWMVEGDSPEAKKVAASLPPPLKILIKFWSRSYAKTPRW